MRFKKILHSFLAFLLLLPLSVFFTKPVHAATPTYGYTYTIGGTGSDGQYNNSITTDSAGNIYFTGYFLGTNINFNTTGQGSPDLHSSNGWSEIFITKINANGSYGYTYTMGGTDDDSGRGITTDTSGNIYITGQFNGSNVNFNTTGQGSADLHSSNGVDDIFLTKINANGSYSYTYTMGGTSYDDGYGVTTDTTGNVYMLGRFRGTNVNFNTTGQGSADLHSSNGSYDIFLTKINANGSYGYTYTTGGASFDFGFGIITDSSGNIYITGSFYSSNVNFNTTGQGNADIHSTNGSGDIFITKINASGAYGYTYSMGGTDDDWAPDVAIDSSGNIYITGTFYSSNVNFNTTGQGNADIHSSNGNSDIFVTKINSNGTYGYTYTIGGTSWDSGYGIATDSLGDLYLGGYFGGANVNFNTTGSGSPDVKNTIGGQDAYITKLNSDGSYGWTYTMGGGNPASDWTAVSELTSDTSGNLYLYGFYEDSIGNGINLNPLGGTDIHTNNGSDDIFLTKLSGVFTPITPTPTPSSSNTQGFTMPEAPRCTDEKPSSFPYLFQADVANTKAVLHINPAGGSYNKYFIAFGTRWEGDEEYGVEFNQEHSTGALTYTINDLTPNTLYYFKARAGNGCQPGDWSNNFKLKTTGSKGTSKIYTTFSE